MCQGIGREFDTIDLGHKRLDKRAVKLLEALAAKPSETINAALDGWGETVAAYRFFQNDQVEPEKILAAHREASETRIDEHDVVLLVQDTTELYFGKHPAKDSRVLEAAHRFGLYDHSHLALTPQGLPLGVLAVDFFDRAPESLGKSQERRRDPIETKESRRWLEGCQLANEVAESHPDTQIVSVADSEADIYDIYVRLFNEQSAANFLIRAKHDRRTPEKVDPNGDIYKRVYDEVAGSDLKVIREIDLPATPQRVARTARLEIRSMSVTVRPPRARPELGEVEYNVVLVEESGRPADDETKVEWLLITTLPIASPEETLRVVDYYVGRWPIEPFFRTYKTGCRTEEIQLETTERRKRCLLFYKIIAWRIMYLMHLGREVPEMPCEDVFREEEWKPVWKIVMQEDLPQTPPTLGEFLPVLASLGGYNNRPSEPPPGPKPLWLGMRRMLDFALAWVAFGPGAANT